jgi:hypothetical protein
MIEEALQDHYFLDTPVISMLHNTFGNRAMFQHGSIGAREPLGAAIWQASGIAHEKLFEEKHDKKL